MLSPTGMPVYILLWACHDLTGHLSYKCIAPVPWICSAIKEKGGLPVTCSIGLGWPCAPPWRPESPCRGTFSVAHHQQRSILQAPLTFQPAWSPSSLQGHHLLSSDTTAGTTSSFIIWHRCRDIIFYHLTPPFIIWHHCKDTTFYHLTSPFIIWHHCGDIVFYHLTPLQGQHHLLSPDTTARTTLFIIWHHCRVNTTFYHLTPLQGHHLLSSDTTFYHLTPLQGHHLLSTDTTAGIPPPFIIWHNLLSSTTTFYHLTQPFTIWYNLLSPDTPAGTTITLLSWPQTIISSQSVCLTWCTSNNRWHLCHHCRCAGHKTQPYSPQVIKPTQDNVANSPHPPPCFPHLLTCRSTQRQCLDDVTHGGHTTISNHWNTEATCILCHLVHSCCLWSAHGHHWNTTQPTLKYNAAITETQHIITETQCSHHWNTKLPSL